MAWPTLRGTADVEPRRGPERLRTTISDVSSHDEPGRLESLEPAQVAAFRAFQRPTRAADHGLRDDRDYAAKLAPCLNPDLARRVYDGEDGTIDLVPSPDTVCCVVITSDGERLMGSTSVSLAATGSHGFISLRTDPSATFRGVLSTGACDLRIINGPDTRPPCRSTLTMRTGSQSPIQST